MKKLGPLSQKTFDFISQIKGWHSYAGDKQTRGIIKRLKKRGLIETNEFHQFRIPAMANIQN